MASGQVLDLEKMFDKVDWSQVGFFTAEDLEPVGQTFLTNHAKPFEDVVNAAALAQPWLQQGRPLAQVMRQASAERYANVARRFNLVREKFWGKLLAKWRRESVKTVFGCLCGLRSSV